MKNLEPFFTHLKTFAHREIFEDVEWVWDPLKSLQPTLNELLREKSGEAEWVSSFEGISTTVPATPGKSKILPALFVDRWVELDRTIYFEELGIRLGEGTVLEPTAIIKGPALIGKHCEIRQGAYLRGGVVTGDHCVIGHATEVKNSIIMDHTEAGHLNYIGESILGCHVNLGAGSRLANLEFRTGDDKCRGTFPPIEILLDGKSVSTGMEKLGVVLGDNVEVGCNVVFCPAALVGKDCWIYPNTTVPKGLVAPNTFLAPPERKPKTQSR